MADKPLLSSSCVSSSPASVDEPPLVAAAKAVASRRSPAALRLLETRRSTPAIKLCAPGPSPKQLKRLLAIAARVPDHGKRAPWRFVVFAGEARQRAGAVLAQAWRDGSGAKDADSAERYAFESARFTRAPVVVMVVSCATEHDQKIPHWEQVLSAGAVCQNLLIASHAMGFAGQWLTEWYAYDGAVKAGFGLAPEENVAGFLYLGSTTEPALERPRPDVAAKTEFW